MGGVFNAQNARPRPKFNGGDARDSRGVLAVKIPPYVERCVPITDVTNYLCVLTGTNLALKGEGTDLWRLCNSIGGRGGRLCMGL